MESADDEAALDRLDYSVAAEGSGIVEVIAIVIEIHLLHLLRKLLHLLLQFYYVVLLLPKVISK